MFRKVVGWTGGRPIDRRVRVRLVWVTVRQEGKVWIRVKGWAKFAR